MTNLKVVKNLELKGIELYFTNKPKASIINLLKENKFRWHNVKKCWYNKINDKVMDLVNSLSDGKIEMASNTEVKEKKEVVNIHGVKVGDIFSMSWGYEQTNVNYFQVVELKGSTMIKIREIASQFIRSESSLSGYVKPAINTFLERSTWTTDTKGEYNNNDGIYKKVLKMGDTIYLNMCSFANAYLTSAEKESFFSKWY